MNEITNKKKRGCNYTPSEREILVDVVKGHSGIIENKSTNGEIIKKKQTAWQSVAKQYNSVASSGPRTWLQLRHLYENMKQRTKKNVASENRQQYYKKEEDLHKLKLKASQDKKQLTQTGGGSYCTVLTETDQQILAMVAPQIKPLKNQFDDAAVYFGDSYDCAAVYCDGDQVEVTGNVNMLEPTTLLDIEPTGDSYDCAAGYCDGDQVEVTGNVNMLEPTTLDIEPTGNKNKDRRSQNIALKKQCKKQSKTSTKEQYFKIKLGNAKLERKYLMQRQTLELQLLKLKIKRMLKRK